MTEEFPFGDERHYLTPVCGSVTEPGFGGSSCYLSLYHRSDHRAPSRDHDVDGGYDITWPQAAPKSIGVAA